MNRSKTQYAVLGFLKTMGPMSGYSIKKMMTKSTSYFWTESFGALYPTFAFLEKEGAIVGEETISKGGRRCIVYTITPKGVRTLEAWLDEPAEESKERSETLLKLFFSSERSPEKTREHFQEERKRMQDKQDSLSRVVEFIKRQPEGEVSKKYWLMTVRCGQLHNEALIKWCDECLDLLNQ